MLSGCSTRNSDHTSAVLLEVARPAVREPDGESEEGRPQGRGGYTDRSNTNSLAKGNSLKTISLVLLLLISTPAISVADISVGGVSLVIPDPVGFSPVTPQMLSLYELLEQIVPPANVEYVNFIPEQDVPAALQDDIPGVLPSTRFVVRTVTSVIDKSVTTSDFMKLKNFLRSQQDEIIREMKARSPGLMKQFNDAMKKATNVDPAFSFSQMVPLPIHEETDHTVAYSVLVKHEMNDEDGNPAFHFTATTAHFVLVKGKILCLWAYAEESGLEWSREALRQWASAVLAANASDIPASAKEVMPSSTSEGDWEAFGTMAAVYAITCLSIGLIVWAIKRGKASPSEKTVDTQHSIAPDIASLPDSVAWKKVFLLIQKAGGPSLKNITALTFGERMRVMTNIWAFMFGPLYYAANGMWKKGLLLFLGGIALVIIAELAFLMLDIDVPAQGVGPVLGVLFSSQANIDFYKKEVLGKSGWWY